MADVMRILGRVARYDLPKLLVVFNEVCDKAGLSDDERKLVFDAQADYVAFATGHVEGKALTASQFIKAFKSPVNASGMPSGLKKRFLSAQKLLGSCNNGDGVLDAATAAVLRCYFGGGVFK